MRGHPERKKRSHWVSAFFGLIAGIGVGLLILPRGKDAYAGGELAPIVPKAERFYVIEGAGDKFNPATDPLCRPPATASSEFSRAGLRHSALPGSGIRLPADREEAEKMLQGICGSRIKIVDHGEWSSFTSIKNGLHPKHEPGSDARKYLVQLGNHTHVAPSSKYYLIGPTYDKVLINDIGFSLSSTGDQIKQVYARAGGSKIIGAQCGTFYVAGMGKRSVLVTVEF
ncbi:hypothetical protein QPK87_37315 [Kamptonema cortianum]|nr:hypothetical protein [Geitlerinema splendidum]MDK3162168.1 hypothetical protein [Kamptonema cortianum]